MTHRFLLIAHLVLLASCVAPPPVEEDAPLPADVPTHLIEVEREYLLEDPRDKEFQDRIRAEAANVCGSSRTVILSIRPVGTESVGEEFLYRRNEVEVACAP